MSPPRDICRDRVLEGMDRLEEARQAAGGEVETLREAIDKGLDGCRDAIDSMDRLDAIDAEAA